MQLNFSSLITSGLMTFAGKIVAALGVGFVSYQGIDMLQSKFAGYISQQLGSFPVDVLQIFYIGGGGVMLNWVFGAVAFIAGIKATSKLTAIMKSS